MKIASYAKAIISLILYPIKSHTSLFLLTWIMSCAICLLGRQNGIESNLLTTGFLSIFDCYLLCVLAALLQKIKLGWLAYVIAVSFLFSEIFVVLFNHSFLNRYTVQLVLETDGREGTEFVTTVLFQSEMLWAIFITLLSILITIFIRKCLNKFIKCIIPHFVFSLYLLCMILWSCVWQGRSYEKLYNCFHANNALECEEPECMPFLDTPIVRLVYGIAYNSVLSTTELERLAMSMENTRVDSCSFRCPLIIVVIGESYSKHHCYLYNKEGLPNTPRMQRKVDLGNLFIYNDVVSPFNHTHEVFKYMFSTWDDTCSDSWSEHTLFTAVFKKAGYRVLFVTNQFTQNTDDKINVLGGTIFNQKRLSDLQFTNRNKKSYTYDEGLFNEMPSSEEIKKAPTILIVHLLGQHVTYWDRYPSEAAIFKPEEAKNKFGGDKCKTVAISYENATFYNDWVVDSLLNKYADTDMIALYFSDHGEEVYDWREKFMRTDEKELLPEVAHFQYEIPFMFYMTDEFIKRHKDIAADVKSSCNKPFILTDLPNILFHLGGIHMKDYQAEKDLLSPLYNIKRKRMIRKDIDYDLLMKEFKHSIESEL